MRVMRGIRRAGRFLVPCLVLLLTHGALADAKPAVEIELRRDHRCGGIAGALNRGGVRVEFESRVTASGVESRILSSTGEVLSEIVVDESARIFEYRVGGVTLSENVTPEEAERVASALGREEAALASEHLWGALASKGYSPKSREMAALAANLTGYKIVAPKGPPDLPDYDCFGCCGSGCAGCTGCYTRACLDHDICVMYFGHVSPRCLGLLYLAALSAWCCQGVDMGSLC